MAHPVNWRKVGLYESFGMNVICNMCKHLCLIYWLSLSLGFGARWLGWVWLVVRPTVLSDGSICACQLLPPPPPAPSSAQTEQPLWWHTCLAAQSVTTWNGSVLYSFVMMMTVAIMINDLISFMYVRLCYLCTHGPAALFFAPPPPCSLLSILLSVPMLKMLPGCLICKSISV